MKFSTLLLAALTAVAAFAQDTPASFEPDRKIVFKQVAGDDLQLHVFTPPGWKPSDRRPAIVFFFGGGWVGGNPSQFYAHSRYLSLRGMVAVSAQYRTQSSHGVDPFACIADGKSAIRWVRAHASELGVDPDKVASGGGSAGGHVAASAGVLPGLDEPGEDRSVSSRPQAMVLFNPVIDTTEKGYGAEKLGSLDRQLKASPAHNVRAGAPPTMIFHGTQDTTVPFENVQRFCAEMEQAGAECTVVAFEGEKHGFFNYNRNLDAYLQTIDRTDEFLRRHGFLK